MRSGRFRADKFAVAALTLTLVVLTAVFQSVIRHWEVLAYQPLVWLVSGGSRTTISQDTVHFDLGTTSAFGLRISLGCSIVVLFIAFVVALSAFSIPRGVPVRRFAAVVATGLILLLATNTLRVGVIALFVSQIGRSAFEVGHWLVGSLLAVAGFTVALVLAVRRIGAPPGRGEEA